MRGLIPLFRPLIATRTSSIPDQQTRAVALQTTGLTLYNDGQYADAIPCLESALSLWTVLGNFQAEQRLFQWLGSCYWNLGEIQAAQCCYQEALTLAQALDQSAAEACGKRVLGNFLSQLRDQEGQLNHP